MSGPAGPKDTSGIWILPVAGGPLRKLQDDAWGAAASPDDSRIVFFRNRGRTIWLMNSDGGQPRQLLAARPGYSFTFEAPIWAPDGHRIAFGERSQAGDEFAIESYDLNTSQTSVILSDAKLRSFCWARDGRIIYSRLEDPPDERSANLWQIRVDPRTAHVRGKPRRLTEWSGFLFNSLAVSRSAERLFAVGMHYRSNVYLADLELNRTRFTALRRFTVEEWLNRPTGWTRDSQAVLLYSDHSGEVQIYKHGVNAREAEVIVTGPEEKRDARLSPDGRWILYLAWPKVHGQIRAGEGRLMRVAVGGGTPQVVLPVIGYPGPAWVEPLRSFIAKGHPRFRCPSAPQFSCVLGELVQNQLVFTAFDPVEGRKGELFRIEVKGHDFWDLSPDGRLIAFGSREMTSGRIQLLPVGGGSPRQIFAGDWTHLEEVAWAADGKTLFVTGFSSKGGPLLRVSLDGRAQLLHQGATFPESPVASPDGRYLAFSEMTAEGNGWVVENFGK